MERPGSRGSLALAAAGISKAPTGSPIERPERPNTANANSRLTTGQPQQQAAASGGARGGTAQPPGTAMKHGGVLGGAAAIVRGTPAPSARPLTQQGVGGLAKPGTSAGGRQVLDRNYFLSQLRQKRQEIINATHELQEEVEELQQHQAAAARANKRAGELQAQVRALQESLADANIVLDKAGLHAPLDSIAAELDAAKSRNNEQRARAEGMAADRMALEAAARQAEARVADLEAAAEARLATLPPGQRAAYQALQQEHEGLLADAAAREAALAELDEAVAAAEGELGRNPAKRRTLELQEAVRQLQQQHADLAAAEERAKATPEEQREALMSKAPPEKGTAHVDVEVKRDNAELERLAAEAKATQEEVRALEARQQQAGAAGGGGCGGVRADAEDERARREKFEELCAKDREITAFMDAFPARREDKRRELAERRDAAEAAIERLARQLAAGGGVGAAPARAAQAARPEQQHAPAEGSAAELSARSAELAKIQGLGAKITEELAALDRRISEAEAEAGKLSDVGAARAAAEARQAELESKREELARGRDAAKAALSEKTRRQEAKESELSHHPAWPAARRAEEHLASLQQQAAAARAAVVARAAEADCSELAARVASLVSEVNALLLANPMTG
ncbi:intraflagellar transport protein 74/72 [Monoraphidium neglectum]|uniref:Intraflagellar transport protein 74/72 n=1 Tax=Monoraphidium neglectum TaxID=145388 RepID=A0A0D2MXQ8_9CHLO|nr:intraflagellar transport protein 74/72 [Monoraphidium neglectum]KIZ05137.1 intraflagellar transport protein 74/72 [Monoraphidium neglectum]|eukprot:XP_013904156.1 intraflagellar transport protein 74/72 [Monoraphidium neglectum]